MVLLPSFIETSKWGEENVPQQIAVGQSMIEMEDVSTCLDHQIGYHLVPDSIYIYMHYIHLMLSNVIDSYRFAFMVGALYNLYMAACIVLIHSNDIPNSNQPPTATQGAAQSKSEAPMGQTKWVFDQPFI